MFILNEIMKAKKITSQQLSEMTGIPKKTIDDYRGKRMKEPSFSKGLKIADALDLDPHELFREEEQE